MPTIHRPDSRVYLEVPDGCADAPIGPDTTAATVVLNFHGVSAMTPSSIAFVQAVRCSAHRPRVVMTEANHDVVIELVELGILPPTARYLDGESCALAAAVTHDELAHVTATANRHGQLAIAS